MLLGQSVFQSVLTRLKDEQKDDEETAPEDADFRIRGLGAGFLTPDGRPAGAEADTGAYFDYLSDWPGTNPDAGKSEADTSPDTEDAGKQPEAPVMPPHLERLTEAEIAEDLAISSKDGEAALNEKRRQFAKLNHPDRVAPEFRDNATMRMKTANLMIDRALASLYWR
ncbi:hypothetical protein [Aliirhizobium smilacinae]|uniref:J domain-containing protein n=1 Tax=Aliirhizobium smilacinae TaxID=1395944 RepID=A0A5C4XHF5_9HYPH|nr:hypothetical protein [Rhizobium smilacinae]TNM62837.1 hypothetical protein FHP24_16595 [Rhizobium smilacinae]